MDLPVVLYLHWEGKKKITKLEKKPSEAQEDIPSLETAVAVGPLGLEAFQGLSLWRSGPPGQTPSQSPSEPKRVHFDLYTPGAGVASVTGN